MQKEGRLLDAGALTAGLIAIGLYSYFVSRHRIFWSDELFGWALVTDPSWHHMIAAWRDGADGGGLGFYLLGRGWLDLFGRTRFAFRAFSAAGCLLGYSALWFTLKRYYSTAITLVTLFTIWFGSETIRWQMIQTRFYGLLLGAAALAFYAAVRSANEEDARPSTLLLTAIANVLLIESHPFGLLCSAAILLGCAASDWLNRHRHPGFYIAAAAPWLLLIFSRTAMLNSAKVGQPWFWTYRPSVHDLLAMYSPSGEPWRLAFIVALVLIGLIARPSLRKIPVSLRSRSTILLPAAALGLLPLPIWVISRHGASYFVDRYLISFCIGLAVLLAEALTVLFPLQKRSSRRLFAAFAVCLLLYVGASALWRYPRQLVLPPLNYTSQLAADLPANLPVVFERMDVFDVMLHQQPSRASQMFYLLDWPIAIAHNSPRNLVSGYHEMENWKRDGYFSSSILQSQTFLASTNRFVVVHSTGMQWFDQRILDQPQWKAQQIGDFNDGYWSETIWLVQRR